MKVIVNVKKLIAFKIASNKFKGFTVGQQVVLPTEIVRYAYLTSNIGEVTSFNPKYNIIHWKSKHKFGGFAHSGSHYLELLPA